MAKSTRTGHEALLRIYHSLFQERDDPSKIQNFQRVVASYASDLGNEDAKNDFFALLITLNDGEDPELNKGQIEALLGFMRYNQGCRILAPFFVADESQNTEFDLSATILW